MRPFRRLTGCPVPLPLDNVDTDQIIPASFLKVVDREGLAEGLFHGWRFRGDGTPNPEFILHDSGTREAGMLLVGDNFGCGSSREHAPWALQAWGFRAILGKGFADIFKGNAHRNGLLTVTISPDLHDELLRRIGEGEDSSVTVDLESQSVTISGGAPERFEVDAFARHCMLHGVDPMEHLLKWLPAIEAYEAERPQRVRLDRGTGSPPAL